MDTGLDEGVRNHIGSEDVPGKAGGELEPRVEERISKLSKANQELTQEIADRERVEEELRSSEERLRILFEFAPDAYYLNDMQGNFIDGNRAAQKMLGYDKNEVIGKSFLDLGILVDEDLAKAADVLARNAGGQPSGPDEFNLVLKDGSRVRVEITTFPVKIHGQDLVLGMARDVGERTRTEEALRESEHNYRVLFDSVIEGVLVVDAETMRVVLANRAAAHTYGFDSTDEVIGFSPLDFFADDERDRVLKVMGEDMFVNDLRRVNEFRSLTRDGREIWISAVGARTEYQGRVAGLISFREVTERKMAEAALAESEERYRCVVELSPEAIVIHREGKVAYINAAGADLYGASDPEQIIGRPVLDFVHPRGVESVAHRLSYGDLGKVQVSAIEQKLVRLDGRAIDVEVTAAPITYMGTAARQVVIRDITERKQAEEALRESERLYRLITENVTDIIMTTDMGFRPTYVSPSVAQVTGFGVEEWMAGSMADALTPASRDIVVEAVAEELELTSQSPGEVFKGRLLELEICRKDGSTMWAEVRGTLLCDPEGQPTGILCVMSDITERKQAEEASRETEKRYRLLAENITDVIFSTDMNMTPTYMSPSITGLLGYSVEESMARSVVNSLTPASQQSSTEALATEMSLEEAGSNDPFKRRALELEFIRKDGSKVWVEVMVSFIYDAQGQPVEIIGVLRDIAQRKQAEEALRRSEGRYRLLAENVTDVIWTMDEDMRFTYVSPSVEHLRGYNAGETVAQTLDETMTAESVEAALEGFARRPDAPARQDGSRNSFTLLLELKCKDGSTVWTENHIAPLLDPDGRKIGYLGVSRDITERQRSEAKLKETMDELARSNSELEQFAYVASHDLQEPLRMVSSYVQLLARRYEGSLDKDADDFIGFAVDGARRMQNLINDLLAYSRVGTRGKPFTQVDCDTLLREVTSNLKLAIEESGAVITNDPLPTVMADPSQLMRLFQNLIDNAIKFSGDEPPQVHVSAHQENHHWVLSVRDNGIGIAPEFFDRIFMIFQRLHARAMYAGTGIGLAVCKKIVERHGGRIWVRSEPGKGATFCFTIPMRGDNQS